MDQRVRVAGGAAGRCSAAAGGSLCGHSRACRSAFDAVRARDAARAADRPRRRPWWSVAAIRARSLAPRLRRRRCGHGPEPGRGWRLAVLSQQSVPRCIRRSARQRCGYSRGSPQEAAVVVDGGDPRAAARASVASSKMRPLADTRPRLAARRAVSAERAAAHSTQRAPEMRLEPRIGDRPRRRPWWSVARIAAFARCTATNYHSQT